jgi:hypothetical protein
MVKVTAKDESIRRGAEGSIQAFLNGKKNQNWAIAMIQYSGISKEMLKKLFSEFYQRNPMNEKLQALEKGCRERGFL